MSTKIFEMSAYKEVMTSLLTGEGRRGELTRAAQSLGCQRSYLSRVLTEELHLTTDHAFKLAQYFKFSNDERDYFLALVESERAAGADYRSYWNAKATELRKKRARISEATNRQDLSVSQLHLNYFTSWTWSAIHFLTSIPEFQTVAAITARLGMTSEQVTLTLEGLQAQGLVESYRGKWRYKSGEFHVDKSSPLVIFHHQNWRQRAVLDSQNTQSEAVHYTAVQTLSRKDAEKLKALLLDFIRESSRIAGPSVPEEAIVLTLDCFSV